MLVQISWPHIIFMLYWMVVITLMILVQQKVFKTSDHPIRIITAFALYWPIHVLPCMALKIGKKIKKWRHQKTYNRWKEKRKGKVRGSYVTVRPRN
jgi:hypothetical protein